MKATCSDMQISKENFPFDIQSPSTLQGTLAEKGHCS